MKNFDRPYHSKSISEFWTRWHISLSSWFKDYLYISLGGNRVSIPRWYFNLFFVFMVSGLWHGANWTFIIWGALHGLYLIIGIMTKNLRSSFKEVLGIDKIQWLNNLIQIFVTFMLVTVSWVFFRAHSFNDALYILGKFPAALQELSTAIFTNNFYLGENLSRSGILISIALIILLEVIHLIQTKYDILTVLNKQSVRLRWAFYYLVVFVIIYFGVFENRQFIYFQF